LESKGCEICFLLLSQDGYLKGGKKNIFFFFSTEPEKLANCTRINFSQKNSISVSFIRKAEKDGEQEGKKKVENSFGDDIKRIQNEKISNIIKVLPGIENAKKKFSLEIFISF
jgi:hypothetical protein